MPHPTTRPAARTRSAAGAEDDAAAPIESAGEAVVAGLDAAALAAAQALAGARRVVALTGAGMSADSGVATFRDAGGLWATFDPETHATPRAFARDPARVWRWYAQRRRAMAGARPHAGHRALAALEARLAAAGGDVCVVTQNIDGLHGTAGSRNVVAVHGDIFAARCFDCGADAGRADDHDDGGAPPPRCAACGGRLRPAVVWFGEALPMAAVGRALAALRACDALLVIGTSGLVEPVARFPLVALERGAVVVEVNPAPTPLSHLAHHVVRGRAAEVLPALLAGLLAARPEAPARGAP